MKKLIKNIFFQPIQIIIILSVQGVAAVNEGIPSLNKGQVQECSNARSETEVFNTVVDIVAAPYTSDIPLSIGRLEYSENMKEVMQIAEIKKFSQEKGSVVVELTSIIRILCDKLLEHAGWQNDDLNLKAYEIFAVCATRNKETKCLHSTEIADVPKQYVLKKTFFKPLGGWIFGDDDKIPKLRFGRLLREYTRPDGTEYIYLVKEGEFLIKKEHVIFVHNNDAHESYQVVRLSVEHDRELHILDNNYKIDNPYPHKSKFLRWEDDKTNHKSTMVEKIYIDMDKLTQDKDTIPAKDWIVIEEKKSEPIFHEKLWMFYMTWILPGPNYKVHHSKEEYR